MKTSKLDTFQLDELYSNFSVLMVKKDGFQFALSGQSSFQDNLDGAYFYGDNVDEKFQPYLNEARKQVEKEFNIDHLEWDTKK